MSRLRINKMGIFSVAKMQGVMGLVIGLGPGEGGKKTVVNVNDAGEGVKKIIAQYLHVFGENHQVHAMVFQQFKLLSFSFTLDRRTHRNALKWNAELRGDGL